MPLTDYNSVVAQALVDLLKDNWSGIGVLEKRDVYYGDQLLYPRFPSVAVEASPQERELQQTGLQQRIRFSMAILAVHGGLKGLSERRKDTDEFAERVVDQIHTDRTLGAIVINGNISSIEPGFVSRGGSLLVTHLIAWTGLSNFTMP